MDVARTVHGVKTSKQRRTLASNVRLYLDQAYAFYDIAQSARRDTAALPYYYSALNIAKALCEFKTIDFHLTNESYKHGLSWKPESRKELHLSDVMVSASTRGVWHQLLDTVGKPVKISNPTKIRLVELFSTCPEISVEYQSVMGRPPNFLSGVPCSAVRSDDGRYATIRIDVIQNAVAASGLALTTIRNRMRKVGSGYVRVGGKSSTSFEMEQYIHSEHLSNQDLESILEAEIKKCCFYWVKRPSATGPYIDAESCALPLTSSPARLPQILNLYTILFWIGSLV